METTEIKRETGPIVLTNKKQRLNEPSDTKKKGKFGKTVDKSLKPKDEIKEEPMDMEKPTSTNIHNTKFRHVCNICDQGFISKVKLDQHIGAVHTPNIPRYICTACNETIKKTNDIKSHQLWHKLSKTPYICGHCGQSLISSYAYSRHLRDHTVEIPPNLWVLDRECPQCRHTFLTNFLYNTHLCAVRTKKCAGCNRQLRNEIEYQRHAAHCAKVYLNYSKHIPVAALAAESTIRIKNENEVEAAAAESFARNAGISLEMTPIVSLTRISTPEILAASLGCSTTEYTSDGTGTQIDDGKMSGKKGSKKGVSRKDLKRVDNLLKSTLDVLVSIKHEPEVHVGIDSETPAPSDETANTAEEADMTNDDGFHRGDDDDDDEHDDDSNNDGEGETAEVAMKREPAEECFAQSAVHIKQEVIDVDNGNLAPTTKMPVLKLKIKKEHGTLNSSIVEEQSVRVEKKKKKKKRKDAMRSKDKALDENDLLSGNGTVHNESEAAGGTMSNQKLLGSVKQEQLDETDEEYDSNKLDSNEALHLEPTVMTTIPIPQFQISAISSGVEFSDNIESGIQGKANDESSEAATAQPTCVEGEVEDIKPNKAELDRLFQIANVSCGVQMEHEQGSEIERESDCNSEYSNSNIPVTSMVQRKLEKSVHKVVKHKRTEQKIGTPSRTAKAYKSTSGVNKISANIDSGISQANLGYLPQIQIKPEPVDRGYEDIFNAYESATNSSATETLQLSVREMAEQEYLNNIDFATIQIKQEKDLDVSDVEMTNTHIVANAIPNGNRTNGEESQYSENDEDSDSMYNEETDEDEEDDDNDDDWVGIKKVEEEKREYRELDMPPLLATEFQESSENEVVDDISESMESRSNEQKKSECDLNSTSNEDLQAPPLMITNIYSQADGGVTERFLQTNVTSVPHDEIKYSHNAKELLVEMPTLKIASVIAGCSTSFDNFSKDDNQFIDNFPPSFAGQLTEVGDVFESRHIRNNERSDLTSGIIDTHPEPHTMSIEISQNKDALLDAQPFPDVRVDNVSVMSSSQTVLNSNINIALNSAQNNPVELVDENLVEEEQNLLNQEMVEAQAFQGLVLGAEESFTLNAPIQNVEEAENLMNESVAEAQMQRQEPHTDVPTSTHMILQPNQLECCDSANDSIEGTSQSRIINNAFLMDESNINEIAENNNNANIERELQDDVASTTTASSNAANSSDNDTDRRNITDTSDRKTTDIT
uniref:Zinc finger protein 771 n=2 Tax=Bactrocera latifrons TaxID=174628 RepID=A0A0K8V8L4_BACLA